MSTLTFLGSEDVLGAAERSPHLIGFRQSGSALDPSLPWSPGAWSAVSLEELPQHGTASVLLDPGDHLDAMVQARIAHDVEQR